MGNSQSNIDYDLKNDSCTVKFNDVSEKKYKFEDSANFENLIEMKEFFINDFDKILFTSHDKNQKSMFSNFGNGLLGTIYMCYSGHYPLVLRPDDIWINILLVFSNYVSTHAEKMRHYFVEHEGKKNLNFRSFGNYDDIELWNDFFVNMTQQIKKNTKNDLYEWTTPEFSTTTKKDEIMSKLCLMNTVKNYFNFGLTLGCGLSKLTLKGTRKDWQILYDKCLKLYEYKNDDLTHWADLLLPVLQEFVNVFDKKINEDFWQRICTSKRRGSGGEISLAGWCLVFAPFDMKGNIILNGVEQVVKDNVYGCLEDCAIVDTSCMIPVKVNDNGNEQNIVLYGAMSMIEYDELNNELKPLMDYGMIIKKVLTYDDLYKYYCALEKENKNDNFQYGKLYFDFALFLANEFKYANEILKDVVDECHEYLRDEENISLSNYVSYICSFLNSSYARKYIDQKKIPDLIKKFESVCL